LIQDFGTTLGEEIMSYATSIQSHGRNPPVASNVLHGKFRGQEWLPVAIATSASARRELETQLVMDRLLREYLTPKSRWE
jgi:hypothetical protein